MSSDAFHNLFVVPVATICDDLRHRKYEGRKDEMQFGLVATARAAWPLNSLTWQAHLVDALTIRTQNYMRTLGDGATDLRFDDPQVSVLLCTVTFYANLAHSLTRPP